jgi:hypothetical protein
MGRLTRSQRRTARRREQHQRRLRRGRTRHGWHYELHGSEQPVGSNVVGPSADELAVMLDEADPDMVWDDAAPALLPLFERVRSYPPGTPPRLEAIVPPGIKVSVGIDIGHAYMHVTQAMLERWQVTLADLVGRALANVHGRAASLEPDAIVNGPVADVDVAWLQTGRGIGSTLVLAPSELRRLFGDQRRLFVAPMRDLLVGLPPGELGLAAWIYADIAQQDPNHLQPRAFHFDGQSIRVEMLG